jgi:hypothetical protein
MQYVNPASHEPEGPQYLRLLERVDRMAALLDSKYPVPFTRVRFGWDAIIGLVPVAGDLVSAAASVHLIRCARRLGADGRLTRLMVLNLVVDAVVGAVPIAGTVFDVFFRANERNLKLLVDDIQRRRMH